MGKPSVTGWGKSLEYLLCHSRNEFPHSRSFLTGITRFFLLDLLSNLFYIAKQMKRGELLGSLEHIILLALARLDESAHGMIVRREIEERIGRNISIGAVYATLERLEAKGYVSSFTGEPTPERGGRAKRLFRVEAAGKRALQVSEQTLRSMTAGLESRWGGI